MTPTAWTPSAAELTALARFVTTPSTVVTICVLILVAAAVAAVWIAWRCREIGEAVAWGRGRLAGVESPQEFTARVDSLNTELGSHGLLGGDWRQFQRGLLPSHSTVPFLRTPVDPHEIFRLDSSLGRHLNLRLANALPSYLTGVGIFFTFAGLVAGIHLGASGLASEALPQVMEALQQLLKGAGLAFATSMTGLFASILVSLYEKARFRVVVRELDDWHERLRNLVPVVSTERLAAEQLVEQERQTVQLEKFNTELAISVASALDARLGERLGPVFDQLQTTLDEVAKHHQALGEEVLKGVGEQISTAITGAAGEELKAAGAAIKQVSETLGSTTEAVTAAKDALGKAAGEIVTKVGKSFQEGSEHLTRELNDALARMTGGLTAAASGVRNELSVGADSLKDAVSGCEAVVRSSEEVVKQFGVAVGNVTSVLGTIDEAHTALRSTSAAVLTAARELARLGDISRRQVEAGAGAAASINEAVEKLMASQKTAEAAWAAYETRFQEIDEALASVTGELTRGASAYTEQVVSLHQALDRDLSKAISDISGAVAALSEAVQELQLTLEQGESR
jgi:hypothetical protein